MLCAFFIMGLSVLRYWRNQYSACFYTTAASNYSVVVGLHEHGYEVMQRVEQTLESHLSFICVIVEETWLTSNLVGKAFVATGHSGAFLHTMAELQVF